VSTQDRAPAFQFYAKDWLAEPKVRALSWADRGRYIDLLASMWEYSVYGDRIPRKVAQSLYGDCFISKVADGSEALVQIEDWEGAVWLTSGRLNAEALKVRSRSLAAKVAAEASWVSRRAQIDGNADA
jgi:hypothetical protein